MANDSSSHGDDQFSSPWLDESFATWTSYLPFGGWKKCASYRFPSADARITNDMGYWLAHPSDYDTIYGGGGCMLANLADLFGLDRFVQILHDYAHGSLAGRDQDRGLQGRDRGRRDRRRGGVRRRHVLGPLAGGLNDRRPG